jgi:hypothetical protein
MPQFILLLYADSKPWLEMPPEEQQKWFAKYAAWGNKAQQEGYLVGGQKLVDDAGKVIRGPKLLATDGPYSETKEVLGGFYIIEAANYDEAVRRCQGHPQLEFGGVIELRQIQPTPSRS